MHRSIQLYRYEYPISVNEIQQVLEKNKKISFNKKNKLDRTEEIMLTAKLSEIKRVKQGITGHVIYEYQEVLYKDSAGERDVILTDQYDFFVSPSEKCFVVAGSSIFRGSVARLLSETLHRDEEKSSFSKITIDKDTMWNLVMKIKEFDLENDVERPNFEFINKKLDKLDDIDYSQVGTCITSHPYFKKHFPLATYWSPKMRIRKCNGIVDDPQVVKVGLTLGKSAEFSLTQTATGTEWSRFVLETCKSIGIF